MLLAAVRITDIDFADDADISSNTTVILSVALDSSSEKFHENVEPENRRAARIASFVGQTQCRGIR